MAAFALNMLAGGYLGFDSFSDRLAFNASVEVGRHHGGSLFQIHQGLIHASCQSPRRLISGTSHKVPPHSVSIGLNQNENNICGFFI
jgi:hypothetical protein